MIKNIIFDVDEVLFDTIRQYISCCEDCGMKPDIYRHGRRGTYEFRTRPETYVEEYYNNPPIRSGALALLKNLYNSGIKLYTMSAARRPDRKRKAFIKCFGDIITPEFSPKSGSKLPSLRKLIKKYGLNPAETLYVDDRTDCIRSGIRAGLHVVRMTGEFTLPMPKNMAHIPSVRSLKELHDHILKLNN